VSPLAISIKLNVSPFRRYQPRRTNFNPTETAMGSTCILRRRRHYRYHAARSEGLGLVHHECFNFCSQLTHNVHGPHDEEFYKLLSILEEEYATLQRNGYAGEGFHSKGHRLGTGVSHDLPPHLARLRALEAAEKRKRLAGMMSGGGQKLGGGNSTQGMTPRELAALVNIVHIYNWSWFKMCF
jgi:hypothetical protein